MFVYDNYGLIKLSGYGYKERKEIPFLGDTERMKDRITNLK